MAKCALQIKFGNIADMHGSGLKRGSKLWIHTRELFLVDEGVGEKNQANCIPILASEIMAAKPAVPLCLLQKSWPPFGECQHFEHPSCGKPGGVNSGHHYGNIMVHRLGKSGSSKCRVEWKQERHRGTNIPDNMAGTQLCKSFLAFTR